jgi:hypothetical protein
MIKKKNIEVNQIGINLLNERFNTNFLVAAYMTNNKRYLCITLFREIIKVSTFHYY